MDTGASAVNRPVRAGRMKWLLVVAGLLSVVAGVILIVQPGIGLVTLAVVSGIFLVVDGITETVWLLMADVQNRSLGVVAGIVSILVGIVLIRHPASAVVVFALLLGLWLIVAGAVRAASALDDPRNRGWRLLGALVEVVAGVVIVASPGIGVATLALLVGLAFILRGLAVAAIGWFADSLERHTRVSARGSVTAT